MKKTDDRNDDRNREDASAAAARAEEVQKFVGAMRLLGLDFAGLLRGPAEEKEDK